MKKIDGKLKYELLNAIIPPFIYSDHFRSKIRLYSMFVLREMGEGLEKNLKQYGDKIMLYSNRHIFVYRDACKYRLGDWPINMARSYRFKGSIIIRYINYIIKTENPVIDVVVPGETIPILRTHLIDNY